MFRQMISAKKYYNNPVIFPIINQKGLRETATYNPASILKDRKVFLLYRSEEGYGNNAISRINLASSRDGFNFKCYSRNPIIDIESEEEKMGCEDPRIIKIENKYFLTYTAYSGKDKSGDYKIKLCGAVSKDLINWRKIGSLIPKDKSGAIVQNYKFEGKYVMYFGGKIIRVAFSKDLKRWRVFPRPVISARKGNFFDNHLVEGGAPPIVTKGGILVFYNGKNDKGKFSTGLAIFDKNNPIRLLKRYKKPILEPTEYWEKFGKINNVVFATGLVYFKNKWLLYYGGADKSIGVAIMNP